MVESWLSARRRGVGNGCRERSASDHTVGREWESESRRTNTFFSFITIHKYTVAQEAGSCVTVQQMPYLPEMDFPFGLLDSHGPMQTLGVDGRGLHQEDLF